MVLCSFLWSSFCFPAVTEGNVPFLALLRWLTYGMHIPWHLDVMFVQKIPRNY
jgi:hypothetical protein